jgi:hypothetical protein
MKRGKLAVIDSVSLRIGGFDAYFRPTQGVSPKTAPGASHEGVAGAENVDLTRFSADRTPLAEHEIKGLCTIMYKKA